MGLSYRTANHTTPYERNGLTTRSHRNAFGLIFAGAFLVSCAMPETLGDKEEGARVSGKGVVTLRQATASEMRDWLLPTHSAHMYRGAEGALMKHSERSIVAIRGTRLDLAGNHRIGRADPRSPRDQRPANPARCLRTV